VFIDAFDHGALKGELPYEYQPQTVYVIVVGPIPLARHDIYIIEYTIHNSTQLNQTRITTQRPTWRQTFTFWPRLHLDVQFYMPIAATSRKKAFYHASSKSQTDLDNYN
jgi:hypothetical protein